jgi:hypothetical protein
MKSNGPLDGSRPLIDLARDLPTTPEDVRVLRELRRTPASWLDLTAEEIDAILPADALVRRPAGPAGRQPFSLDGSEEPS